MAEQTGIITIKGKLGNQIYYGANGKDLVKNISKKPYELSENTKKTAAEFAKLTKVASLINFVLKQYFSTYRDTKVYYRLFKLLPKVTAAVNSAIKGERSFSAGKLSLLNGFQLNAFTNTLTLLKIEPRLTFLPKKELLKIDMPEIDIKSLSLPANAIELIIEFAAIAVDFESGTYHLVQTDELALSIKQINHQACNVSLDLEMENKVVIVAMGLKVVLKSSTGSYVSSDKRFFAGCLQELVLVKNGLVVAFQDPLEVDKIINETPIRIQRSAWIKKGKI